MIATQICKGKLSIATKQTIRIKTAFNAPRVRFTRIFYPRNFLQKFSTMKDELKTNYICYLI